ncbi:DUF2849 domain-containing protein [Altererythrobacter luteolus]|uniref:DUF2849 domain-containing protein n=1 Tax=Pontixanthobacter luteolus TaxID=295089 RepID=A0A6I4V2U8_9SPHN|nr:DUF2849 domain-containing protein [Pontixanthobacter luteolus]MXP47180.1 DUF2849 domain-containing protein [Pontixanthobacter luteolus]
MIILTGNDLKTGAVVWWDGSDWVLHIENAIDVGGNAEAVMAREESARRVNVPYAVEATLTDGVARPNHIKDRIRALGPTVRPDLTLKPADPEIGNWVI